MSGERVRASTAVLWVLFFTLSLASVIIFYYSFFCSSMSKIFQLSNSTLGTHVKLHGWIPKGSGHRLVCYYSLTDEGKPSYLRPEAVDPYLCTHLLIGFASLSNGTIAPPSAITNQVFQGILKLKTLNQNLKVMISVGEITSTGEFAKIIATEQSRTMFAETSLDYLKKYGFDGIDLDWEFPNWLPTSFEKKDNFTELLKAFHQSILKTDNSTILSLAVASPLLIIDLSYDIPSVAKYVDFVSIMSYDYHAFSEGLPFTGANAPLYSYPNESGYFSTLNTNWSSTYWASKGMPKEKINVGIPTYGHSFKLINANNAGWNAPAQGFGDIGDGGFVMYGDVCKFLSDPKTKVIYDIYYRVPYAYNKLEWISFDNIDSYDEKIRYILENGFGGGMLFSLNYDDFNATCDAKTHFPLTKRLSAFL